MAISLQSGMGFLRHGRNDDTFLVICRDPFLIEKCPNVLHKSDLVCVKGRLVLTLVRSGEDLVPLAEILVSDVILVSSLSSPPKNLDRTPHL